MSVSLQLACFNCGKNLTDGIFCDKKCREEYGRKQLEMQNRDEHDARWRETHPKAPRPVSLNPLLLPPRKCPCGSSFSRDEKTKPLAPEPTTFATGTLKDVHEETPIEP